MLQFKVLYAISTQRYCAQQNVGSRHYQAKDVYTVVRFTLYLNHFLSNEKQIIGLYSDTLIKINHDFNYQGDEFITFWQVIQGYFIINDCS
jgi:hypothetical protein